MRLIVCAALAFLFAAQASAVELSGVTMPDTQEAAGAHLVLNGAALRTYSILGVRIYVAGLYVTQPTHDPAVILDSTQPRLLRFVFLREVSAEAAQKSWRDSLAASCQPPCHIPPDEVARFLAGIPTVHPGEVSTLLFTRSSVDIAMNGTPMGQIPDPAFERVILSTFIGDHPTAQAVKRGLLGTSAP